MRFLVFTFLGIYSIVSAQSFPKDWLGTYDGKMCVASRGSEQTIAVSLTINTIKKDSSWTYLMTYNAPTGKLKKNYIIRKEPDGNFTLDEGGLLIPLLFSNSCFYDHYVLDSMYFNSVLSYRRRGRLEFNLYGGSQTMTNARKSNQEGTTISAYLPSFSQRALLKRRKK